MKCILRIREKVNSPYPQSQDIGSRHALALTRADIIVSASDMSELLRKLNPIIDAYERLSRCLLVRIEFKE